MIKLNYLTLILACIAVTTGCQERSKLSLEDITFVSGITKWTFVIPTDLKESEHLSLVWQDEEGIIENEFSFQSLNYSGEVEGYGWTDSGSADYMRFIVTPRDSNGEKNQKIFHKFIPPEGYHCRGHMNTPLMKEGDSFMFFRNSDGDEIELALARIKL